MVEAGAVRGDELAGGELGAGAFTEVHPIAGGVFAEVGDDLVAGAEQGDTGREVRDDHDAVLFVEMAGEVDAGVEREVAAVEGEALEAMIATVGHQQGGGGAAAVENETVGAGQLSGGRPLASEGAEEGAFGVLLVDEIGAVTVGDVDVAIGGEGDVGG